MFSALFFIPLPEFLLGEKHFLVVTMEDEGRNDHPVQPAATTPTGTMISVESDEENDAAEQPAAGAASASSMSGKKRSTIRLKKNGGNTVCLAYLQLSSKEIPCSSQNNSGLETVEGQNRSGLFSWFRGQDGKAAFRRWQIPAILPGEHSCA